MPKRKKPTKGPWAPKASPSLIQRPLKSSPHGGDSNPPSPILGSPPRPLGRGINLQIIKKERVDIKRECKGEDDDMVSVPLLEVTIKGSLVSITTPAKLVLMTPTDEPQAGPSHGVDPNPDWGNLRLKQEPEVDYDLPSSFEIGSSEDEQEGLKNEEIMASIYGTFDSSSDSRMDDSKNFGRDIPRDDGREGDLPLKKRNCPVRYCGFDTRWATCLQQHCVKYHGLDGGYDPSTANPCTIVTNPPPEDLIQRTEITQYQTTSAGIDEDPGALAGMTQDPSERAEITRNPIAGAEILRNETTPSGMTQDPSALARMTQDQSERAEITPNLTAGGDIIPDQNVTAELTPNQNESDMIQDITVGYDIPEGQSTPDQTTGSKITSNQNERDSIIPDLPAGDNIPEEQSAMAEILQNQIVRTQIPPDQNEGDGIIPDQRVRAEIIPDQEILGPEMEQVSQRAELNELVLKFKNFVRPVLDDASLRQSVMYVEIFIKIARWKHPELKLAQVFHVNKVDELTLLPITIVEEYLNPASASTRRSAVKALRHLFHMRLCNIHSFSKTLTVKKFLEFLDNTNHLIMALNETNE